ncbi:MAG: hypothetical protein HYV41_03295 [Candidatus Magasanikbacteria bacterium]|nr:hypothetical protein [Candidatus Magasanikbacteria bacterium]
MDKKYYIAGILILCIIFSFIPFWIKELESGTSIRINFWQKFFMHID